jgi:hypothetical protein
MKKMLHWLAHKFGSYKGTVESFYIGDVLYVGFKCSKCGEINLAHKSDIKFSYETQPGTDTEGDISKDNY